MQSRFGNHEMAGWTKKGPNFDEELLWVRYLVQHPECEYEIGLSFETYVIWRANPKVDSVPQILVFCPLLCPFNHLGLYVKGDDATCGSNQLGECNTEVTQAAADIDNSVARGYEFTQDRFGPMNESP